jgi:hypothetical protein
MIVMDSEKKPRGRPKEPDSKRSQGVERHTQPRLVFHLPQSLLDAFRAHIESIEPKPNEAEVLRLALRRYLESVGRWPPKPPPSKH